MSKLSIYKTSWIDLVFENRNKEYGAYSLRQENTKTSLFALFTGASLLMASIYIPAIYNHLNPDHRIPTVLPNLPPIVVVDIAPYDLPQTKAEEIIIPKIKNPITENSNTNTQLTHPEIVLATLATPNIATNIELKNNSNTNPSGEIGTGINSSVSTGTNPDKAIATISDNAILSSNVVDKMPEFPGGIKKFYSYVGTNFEKPELESENIIRISVSFVIEKDGSMTEIKVLRDPGYGLGAEAIRVLKSLKTKWSPGMFEGKAVRTSYNLPISIQPN